MAIFSHCLRDKSRKDTKLHSGLVLNKICQVYFHDGVSFACFMRLLELRSIQQTVGPSGKIRKKKKVYYAYPSISSLTKLNIYIHII